MIVLSVSGLAGAETSSFTASTEDDWRLLLEVQERVPGFAGVVPTPSETDPNAVTPLLVFPNLADRAREVIGNLLDLGALPNAFPARYSARTLVGAARRVEARDSSVQPQVDIGLNRVVVAVPQSHLDRLAHQWGLPRALLVAREERPRFEETLVVQGRIVEGEPLEGRLRVRIRNPLGRPAAFSFGCGGLLPLRVLDPRGRVVPEKTPGARFICRLDERQVILQPGEAREFPALPFLTTAPEAGDYALRTERGERLFLRVWPR